MTDKNEPGTGSSPADDWADALAEQSRANPPTQADGLKPQDSVSYTHLTLPTSDLV